MAVTEMVELRASACENLQTAQAELVVMSRRFGRFILANSLLDMLVSQQQWRSLEVRLLRCLVP